MWVRIPPPVSSHWGGIDRKASHVASLQNRNSSYRLFFEYQRQQQVFTVGRVTEPEAKSNADQVDSLKCTLRIEYRAEACIVRTEIVRLILDVMRTVRKVSLKKPGY